MDCDARRSRHAVQDARGSDAAGDLRAALPSGRAEGGRPRAGPPGRPPDPLQRPARRPRATDRLDQSDGRLLGEPVRRPRRPAEEDGPMTAASTETVTVVVERE